MRNYLVKGILALACLSMIIVPGNVGAQTSSDMAMGVRLNTSTASPGASVGVFGWVQNNTSARARVTTWFTSTSPCGGETMLSGYAKFALNGGQGIQVTVGYPLPPDACKGTYAVTLHAKSGGKNAEEYATTCYLVVQ